MPLINNETITRNKLKEFGTDLKNFKVQVKIVSEYNKKNDVKTFHSSVKLIASDSEIKEAFKSMHGSTFTKNKTLYK